MATDQLINKAQGDAIISGLTAIKNAINDLPVPTQVEDVVADAFDVGVSYVPGDYCIYENKLYVCDVAHHGAWDGNDFTLTTVGAVLESLNNDLNDRYPIIDNNKSFVVLNTSIAINSYYEAPVDGIYSVSLAAAGAGTSQAAIIYFDSGRTLPIISIDGGVTNALVFLKAHTKIYTRNLSGPTYRVLGYIVK